MIKIILSALNEARNLQILLPRIAAVMHDLDREFEIILCIDASNDDSQDTILAQQNRYPIRILNFYDKKGLGNAFKRLFIDVCAGSDDDLVISMDADNTHDPRQIIDILRYFDANNLDLLVLSRFCKGAKVIGFPFYRILISRAVSLLMRFVFRVRKNSGSLLKDYSSGYRAYKLSKLKELVQEFGDNFVTKGDFTYTCEILIKLSEIGARIDEIGLFYDYSKKIGKSKMRFFGNAKSLIELIIIKVFRAIK